MFRPPTRRRIRIEQLETRKLMAVDAFHMPSPSDRFETENEIAVVTDMGSVGDTSETADDVYVDGKIITAENYDSAARSGELIANAGIDPGTDGSATDAFFNESGRDDSGRTFWAYTYTSYNQSS